MNVINMTYPDRGANDAVIAQSKAQSDARERQPQLLDQVGREREVFELKRRVDDLELQRQIDAAQRNAERVGGVQP